MSVVSNFLRPFTFWISMLVWYDNWLSLFGLNFYTINWMVYFMFHSKSQKIEMVQKKKFLRVILSTGSLHYVDGYLRNLFFLVFFYVTFRLYILCHFSSGLCWDFVFSLCPTTWLHLFGTFDRGPWQMCQPQWARDPSKVKKCLFLRMLPC